MTTVLLTRHGETRWNEQGRVQGWAPVELTATGRAQARAAANTLADRDVTELVTSDLRRARETADVLADTLDVPVRESDAWRERHWGALQGLPSESLLDRFPWLDLCVSDDAATVRPDGGESWRDVQERVLDAFESLAGTGGIVAVVTHFAPILLVLGAVRDEDIETALVGNDVATGSVTELRWADGTWRVVEEDRRPGRGER